MALSPRLLAATAVLASLGALPAVAQAVTVSGRDARATVRCTPQDPKVIVSGSDARVTVTGACSKIVVSARDARVSSTGTVEEIVASGGDSRVTYRSTASGGDARVVVSGRGASVRRVG